MLRFRWSPAQTQERRSKSPSRNLSSSPLCLFPSHPLSVSPLPPPTQSLVPQSRFPPSTPPHPSPNLPIFPSYAPPPAPPPPPPHTANLSSQNATQKEKKQPKPSPKPKKSAPPKKSINSPAEQSKSPENITRNVNVSSS